MNKSLIQMILENSEWQDNKEYMTRIYEIRNNLEKRIEKAREA